MDTNNFKIYLELRQKMQQYQEEVGFECLQCEYGCCKRNIERIPILREDITLLKRENIDLAGVKSFNFDAYCLRRDPSMNHCYYFNQETQACTIHNYKPLYCLSYPFSFKIKNVHYLGKIVDNYNEVLFPNPFCTWIKENGKPTNLENSLGKMIRKLIRQL